MVTEIMFLIKFLPMMTMQVKRVINDKINENSPAECITYTSVTRTYGNKRKHKDIPTVEERKTYLRRSLKRDPSVQEPCCG